MRLERGELTAVDSIANVAIAAIDAPTRTVRLDACNLLGDFAGRALGAEWEVAERAAFVLLEAARLADTNSDRRGVIAAMGRGFRNIWLLPFVHRRISDKDPSIACAALQAAGGLGFPALEEAVASYVNDAASPVLRRSAIASLGRMGAMSAVDRLVPLILGDPTEAAAALAALTEIRSPAGRDAALAVIDHDLEPEVQIAAVRYLAELGALEVLASLRRLARHDNAEIRIAASSAARAFKDERKRDPAERFLVALGEPDRAVRAVLARRLRTLPIADVIEQAELLLSEDAAGVVQILGELRESETTHYLLKLAERTDLPMIVRARAIGSIEADQPWERLELANLAHRPEVDESIRAAAVQAMGAFASTTELLDSVGALAEHASSTLRGAVLWAPIVFADGVFALKGGTAINLFVRDMPRLSVDLDLVFLDHRAPRDEALAQISDALRQAAGWLKARGFQTRTTTAEDVGETKLFVRRDRIEVKVEVNFVMRGTVYPVRNASLTAKARELLLADMELPVVSLEDLYGGKLAAAMDRQHPRDLFDVMQLLAHEGITPGIRRAFVVYLASHNRPIHEVLFPAMRDIRQDYERTFKGMTAEPV